MSNSLVDVISPNPRLTQTARITEPGLLEPVTRDLVRRILMSARAIGLDVVLYDTYRSQSRQVQLFKQGATQLRRVGVHHYGMACDIVRVVNGEPLWKGDFSFLGSLARSAGLIWGGDRGHPERPHSFVEVVHVQRCIVARQPLLFSGQCYPDESYDPYQDIEHPLLATTIPTPHHTNLYRGATISPNL